MLTNLDNLQTELQNANALLADAKAALVNGHALRARHYAKQAAAAAARLERLRDKLLEYISATEQTIYEAYQKGADVIAAQNMLDRAKFALIAGEYRDTLTHIEQSRYLVRRAQFRQFPLFEKDLKIKTIIGYERNRIVYKVRLENDTDEDLGELLVAPFVPSEMFDLDRQEQIVGPLGPQDAISCEFILIPRTKNWSLVTAGKLIQGRDVTIKTAMSTNNGAGVYKVKIENSRNNPLSDIVVYPSLPDWLTTDDKTKTVTRIEPHDAEVVEFSFKPRTAEPEPKPEAKSEPKPEPKPAIATIEREPSPTPEPEPEPQPTEPEPLTDETATAVAKAIKLWDVALIDELADAAAAATWTKRDPDPLRMAYAPQPLPNLPSGGRSGGSGPGRQARTKASKVSKSSIEDEDEDEFVVEPFEAITARAAQNQPSTRAAATAPVQRGRGHTNTSTDTDTDTDEVFEVEPFDDLGEFEDFDPDEFDIEFDEDTGTGYDDINVNDDTDTDTQDWIELSDDDQIFEPVVVVDDEPTPRRQPLRGSKHRNRNRRANANTRRRNK